MDHNLAKLGSESGAAKTTRGRESVDRPRPVQAMPATPPRSSLRLQAPPQAKRGNGRHRKGASRRFPKPKGVAEAARPVSSGATSGAWQRPDCRALNGEVLKFTGVTPVGNRCILANAAAACSGRPPRRENPPAPARGSQGMRTNRLLQGCSVIEDGSSCTRSLTVAVHREFW